MVRLSYLGTVRLRHLLWLKGFCANLREMEPSELDQENTEKLRTAVTVRATALPLYGGEFTLAAIRLFFRGRWPDGARSP